MQKLALHHHICFLLKPVSAKYKILKVSRLVKFGFVEEKLWWILSVSESQAFSTWIQKAEILHSRLCFALKILIKRHLYKNSTKTATWIVKNDNFHKKILKIGKHPDSPLYPLRNPFPFDAFTEWTENYEIATVTHRKRSFSASSPSCRS